MNKCFAFFGFWLLVSALGNAMYEHPPEASLYGAEIKDSSGMGAEDLKEKASHLLGAYFVENRGQIPDGNCLFYTPGGEIFLLRDGFILRLREFSHPHGTDSPIYPYDMPDPFAADESLRERGVVLRYTFSGANRVLAEGRERCRWDTNYFIGNDPSMWRTQVPGYREVIYPNLWDGIDLVFHIKEGLIKYDLVLSPGADPGKIKIKVEGGSHLKIVENKLVIETSLWDVVEGGLVAFYEDEQTENVDVSYILYGENTFGYSLGEYDRGRTVVIDPLLYSTYLGGSSDEIAYDMFVDSNGNVYVVGATLSSSYPTTTGAYDTSYNSGYFFGDVFVTKLNPSGTSLVYSTFLGGSSEDVGYSIHVDSSGNAYVCGWTLSQNFPVTSGALNTTPNGYIDCFVTKLNPSGSSLIYSTYLGGSDGEICYAVVADESGNAIIGGVTASTDFPTTENASDTSLNGEADGFVAKLNPSGSTLLFSTYLGGSQDDSISSIVLDSSSNIIMGGSTESSDFPTTTGAYDTSHNGNFDSFVGKLDSSGSSLLFSTYLGGSQEDAISDIVLDSSSNIIVTGYTHSPRFPTTPGTYDTSHNGKSDAFVAKLNPSCTSLLISTFLGGSEDDAGNEVMIDPSGNIVLVGGTLSNNLPTTSSAFDATFNGGIDVFVSVLSSQLSSLQYSTYVGSYMNESGYAASLLPGNRSYTVYFTGFSDSLYYPTTNNTYDPSYNGNNDVIVTGLIVDFAPPEFVEDHSPSTSTTGDPYTFSVEVTDNVGMRNVSVAYWFGDGNQTLAEMNRTGPGVWNLTITIPEDSLDPMHYFFVAIDTSSNRNTTGPKDVSIFDNDPPIFVTDNTTRVPTTGDWMKFSILVRDNIEVSAVYVEYWFGPFGDHVNVSMSPGEDSFWEYRIQIDINSTETLYYIFHASDTSGNWRCTNVRERWVEDNDPPYFGVDLTPSTATTGDTFKFSIYVYDNFMINEVRVECRYGDNPSWYFSMDERGEGLWERIIRINPNTTEPLHYIFHAVDTFSNWNATTSKTVTILDNDPPFLGFNMTPSEATTGENFTFSVRVYDNIKVDTVWVEYWYGEDKEGYTNVSMEYRNDTNAWVFEVTAADTLLPLYYIFHASDTSGNWFNTTLGTITISDNDVPVILEDRTPLTGETGGNFTFSVMVTDNIEVAGVYVKYWYDDMLPSNESMERGEGDLWTLTIYLPTNYLSIDYKFFAVDSSGNWAWAISKKVVLKDVIPPNFGRDNSTHNIPAGGKATFSIIVTDNIKVTKVFVEYWYGESDDHINISMKYNGKHTWTLTVTVAKTAKPIYYIYHAVDAAGNWAEESKEEYMIYLEDEVPPTFSVGDVPTKVKAGEKVTLTATATDNVAIDRVWVEYWFGEGEHKGVEMVLEESLYTCEILVPENFTGTMHLIFHIEDEGGNWVSSAQYNITVTAEKKKPAPQYALIGAVAGIAAVAVVSVLLLLRRKKHRGEEEE